MKKIAALMLIFGLISFSVFSGQKEKKKILYVDSYHAQYPWSAGITAGIKKVLDAQAQVEWQIIRMDTKRNSGEDFKKAAALKVKDLIESWQPDVVIASDDNASKYLIVPYYKESKLPFVFCGVNWDAHEYGFPCGNVTGMVEVQLIEQIIKTLKKFARGDRLAFLKGDDLSAAKEAAYFEERFKIHLDKRFVGNFSRWQEEYRLLQAESDMILLGNGASISGWDSEEAARLVRDYTKVPTGNWDAWMAPFSLVTYATNPEEQGEWAARTALAIIKGQSPAEIPVVANKKAKIYLNMGLAKKMGIKFSQELIEQATFVDNNFKEE